MGAITQLSGELWVLLGQLIFLIGLGWFGLRYLAKSGQLPGQQTAMAVMQANVDSLMDQVKIVKDELADVRKELDEEKAMNAQLRTERDDARRALALAAQEFLLKKPSGSGQP